MKRIASIVLASLTILSGCIPIQRVFWSPDGRWAVVLDETGTRLVNGESLEVTPLTITPVRSSTTSPATMPDEMPADFDGPVAWFRHEPELLAPVGLLGARWSDLRGLLPEDEVEQIAAAAERARRIMLDGTPPNEALPVDKSSALASRERTMVILYLSEQAGDELSARWEAAWKEVETSVDKLTVLIRCRFHDAKLTLDRVIAFLGSEMHSVQVSPDDRFVSCAVVKNPKENLLGELWLIDLQRPSEPVRVAETAAWYHDWSADGRYLFYIAGLSDAGDQILGVLNRADLAGGLDGIGKDGNPEPMAGLLLNALQAVRVLPDGQLLFSSGEVTLPTVAKDMPQKPSLFAMHPGKYPGLMRILPRQAAEEFDMLPWFAPSPDGTRAALADEDGRIAVLTVATGELQIVQPTRIEGKETSDRLRTYPVWRNNDELTFFAPPGSELCEQGGLVLWSKDKTRCIPGLLLKESDHPATQPAEPKQDPDR